MAWKAVPSYDEFKKVAVAALRKKANCHTGRVTSVARNGNMVRGSVLDAVGEKTVYAEVDSAPEVK